MALTKINTDGIKDTTIATVDIADDAVTADKLANSINTEIAANTAKTTNATHTGEVTGSVALTIANDAVTGAKIADDAVDSEHYTDGSIDTAHIADDAVTADKLANSINTDIAAKATLTGSMNNTVTTVTGANAIQSEANLTFDGTILGVAGNLVFGNTTQSKILHNTSDASDNKFLTINGGGEASQSRGAGITFYGNEVGSNEGRLWIGAGNSGSANGFINFNTAGLERARIDSSGNIGIGTTSPSGASGRALEVNGGSGQARLVLKNDTTGSGSTDGHQIYSAGNTFGIQNREAGDLVFETNGGERFRIDSGGRVGIKNTNMSSFNSGFDDLVIGDGVANSSPGMTIYSHATDIGSISFRDSADTGISGLIQYRHLESSPYMRVMIEGTDRVKFTTDGICFGSDTAAANALDDYEEGDWTPVIRTSASASSHTLHDQYGKYTKIGRLVHCSCYCRWSAYSGSGYMMMQGLPFTAHNSTAGGSNGVSFSSRANWGYQASGMLGLVGSNDTKVYFYYSDANGTHHIQVGATQSTGEVNMSFTYFV